MPVSLTARSADVLNVCNPVNPYLPDSSCINQPLPCRNLVNVSFGGCLHGRHERNLSMTKRFAAPDRALSRRARITLNQVHQTEMATAL
jgi:hypothetical protein